MRRVLALALTVPALVGGSVSTAWTWPADPPRVIRPYEAPAHAYGAGHRGIDIAADGALRAPADGVVAFAGTVVDRGVLTIDHGDGVVSTLEPIETTLTAGTVVARGQIVGEVGHGGHAEPGSVHLGARVDGDYVNPLAFLGGVPRAVLLPCC